MAGRGIIIITGVCAVISRSHKTHRLIGNDKMLGFALASAGPKLLGVGGGWVEADMMKPGILPSPSTGLVFWTKCVSPGTQRAGQAMGCPERRVLSARKPCADYVGADWRGADVWH